MYRHGCLMYEANNKEENNWELNPELLTNELHTSLQLPGNPHNYSYTYTASKMIIASIKSGEFTCNSDVKQRTLLCIDL